jgi:F-box protein 11
VCELDKNRLKVKEAVFSFDREVFIVERGKVREIEKKEKRKNSIQMPSASFSSSRNFRRSKRKSNRNNSDPNEPPVQIPVGGAEQSNESTTSRSASTATTSSLASELASSSSATTNSSATSSNCHQSPPYDLRKKLPTTTATTATTNSGGGSLTESNSSSSSNSTWLGAASTSTSATATSSCCGGSSHSIHSSSLANSNNNSSSSSSNNNNQYQVCTYDSSQPTAKKRPRRTYSSTESTTTLSAHYLQITLPDEVLLTIFSYLSEFDLCRVPLVCKRFNSIANDCELWKRLYQEVFEYDLPLMNPEPCKFSFVKVEDSEFSNPWKESFRQLHHGIHVRPNYVDKKSRNISIFNTINYADEKNASNSSGTIITTSSLSNNNFDMMDNDNGSNFTQESPFNLIFVHTGIYRGEFLVIDSDLKLIGAAPGNVAENIIIESESESTQSTVAFAEGAKNAYIGYMTLKFSPADVSNAVPHHKHYCLEIGENCSPTVDHCIIRSTSVGKLRKEVSF